MSFMKGTMGFCLGTNVPSSQMSLIFTKWDCLDFGGEWLKRDQNFDNFGWTMMTMFQIATLQSWSEIFLNILNTGHIDQTPEAKINMLYSLYFIIFIAIITYFLLNILNGIIISTFNR